jgi:hypothetical protein
MHPPERKPQPVNATDPKTRATLAIALLALVSSLAIVSLVEPRAMPTLQLVIPLAGVVLAFYFAKTS